MTRAGRTINPSPAPLRRVRGAVHGLGGPRDARYRARSRRPGAARVRRQQSQGPERAVRYGGLMNGPGLAIESCCEPMRMASVLEYLMEAFYQEPGNETARQNTRDRLYGNIELHWLSPPNTCGL